MKRPDEKVLRSLAGVARVYPEVLEWIEDWYRQELELLPNVTQNVAFAQGRCQVLKRLCQQLKESPDLVARLKD